MTHAANVIGGYVLTAVVVMAYAAWVVQRGRSLGRGLGIGSTDGEGDGGEHGEHERCDADAEGSEASGTPSAAERSRDAAAPAS